MRRSWTWALGAWSVLVTGVIAMVFAMAAPVARPVVASPAFHRTPPLLAPSYPAESLSVGIVSRDLFRTGRHPAAIAYDLLRGDQAVVTDPTPKPLLTLVGIVMGEERAALIEGIPGTEGAMVVRIGDHIGGLRVRSIEAAVVRLVGMDTMWVLSVREPWQ